MAEKKERWLRYLPARAYDNSLFVAACNLLGGPNPERFFGWRSHPGSQRRSFGGEPRWGEEIVLGTLKRKTLRRVRKIRRDFF